VLGAQRASAQAGETGVFVFDGAALLGWVQASA
jgi:hypothetical protein